MFKHPQDDIVILEEGYIPQCKKCDMFVPKTATKHTHSRLCKQGAELKHKQYVTVEARRALRKRFTVGDTILESVSTFPYIGRQLTLIDDDWPVLYRNLKKTR
jgi:hypothetical protein